jgi:DNA-binding transcriptional LysR family regulator
MDSLELVEQLIGAGLGVGLMPIDWPTSHGVHVLPLAAPGATLRAYAVIRRGRDAWPPLRLVVDRLTLGTGRTGSGSEERVIRPSRPTR